MPEQVTFQTVLESILSVWPLLLGWPAVAVGVLFTFFAVLRRSFKLALLGTLLEIPFMWYLFGTPRFKVLALPVLAANLAAVLALSRGNRGIALMLFMPFVYVAIFVARVVVGQ